MAPEPVRSPRCNSLHPLLRCHHSRSDSLPGMSRATEYEVRLPGSGLMRSGLVLAICPVTARTVHGMAPDPGPATAVHFPGVVWSLARMITVGPGCGPLPRETG